jgi:hypothetical protein
MTFSTSSSDFFSMLLWLRNISAYAICAVASVAVVRWLQSSVILDVLLPNLTTIVLALLAINVQTTAVVAVKLREIADKGNFNFSRSVQQFRLAFYEQGGLFVVSLGLSAISKAKTEVISSLTLECLSFFVIYAALHIFIDTTIGLLVCLFPESDVNTPPPQG